MFNRTGRAYPDIAANAHNYVIYLGGSLYSVDGTSASAPVTAALISLINGIAIRTLLSSSSPLLDAP